MEELACASFVSFSVFINRSPKGFSKAQRGLWQGIPFSPFFFVLVGGALGCMIEAAALVDWVNDFVPATNFAAY